MNHLLRIAVLVLYSASWPIAAQIMYKSPPVSVPLTRPALPWLARYFVGANNPVHHFLDEPQPGPLSNPGRPFSGSGDSLPNRDEPEGGRAAGPSEDFRSGIELGGQGGRSAGGAGPPFDLSASASGSSSGSSIPSPVPVPVPVISAPSLASRNFLLPLPPMPNPLPVPSAELMLPPPSPALTFDYPLMPSPLPVVPQITVSEQVTPTPASLSVPVNSLPPLRTDVPPITSGYAPMVSFSYFSPSVAAVSPSLSLESPRVPMRPDELTAPSESLFYRNVIVGSGGSLPPTKFFAKN